MNPKRIYVLVLAFMFCIPAFSQHPHSSSHNPFFWLITGGIGAVISYAIYWGFGLLGELLKAKNNRLEGTDDEREKGKALEPIESEKKNEHDDIKSSINNNDEYEESKLLNNSSRVFYSENDTSKTQEKLCDDISDTCTGKVKKKFIMYCKHCGKEIDADSTFCKYCGKQLSDATNLPYSLIGYFKQRIVFVALLAIWVLLALVVSADCSSDNYDYPIPFIASFGSLLATLIFSGLIYWLYENYCKFHITLINKSDSVKIKLLKCTYLAYTYCVPFYCVYSTTFNSSGIGVYYLALAVIWLQPTLYFCIIYYLYKLFKLKKNH